MKKIIITLSIFTLLFTACERIDYGDLNQDPYAPSEANIDAMMRGAMIAFAEQSGRLGYSNASLYAQYQTQATYQSAQLYPHITGDWEANYVYVLNNLKTINNTTSDVRGNTVNMQVIAELTSVLAWKRITDTFGDVPYFEALQGASNPNPAYTSQRDIYVDLIARTKAARDMIDPAAFTPDADTDIFYGGDMDKWGKFANSMLLALTIQLSNTSEAVMAQTEFQAALADAHGLIEVNADNIVFTPDTGGGMSNPISWQRGGDYSISKELTDALRGNAVWGPNGTDTKNPTSTVGNNTDFRIFAYAESTTADGLPYGYQTNIGLSGSIIDMPDYYDAASAPFTLFSAAYTWLNRAEGSLIYATGENTNTMFTNGVVASFELAETMSLPGGAGIASFGAAKATERLADVAGSVTMAQVIGEEKWFALFPDGFAAWAEQRRTGFPALHPAPEATNGGVIPHRMLYPSGESTLNPSGWSQGVQGLTPADDKNTSKIWWE